MPLRVRRLKKQKLNRKDFIITIYYVYIRVRDSTECVNLYVCICMSKRVLIETTHTQTLLVCCLTALYRKEGILTISFFNEELLYCVIHTHTRKKTYEMYEILCVVEFETVVCVLVKWIYACMGGAIVLERMHTF